MGTGPSIRWRPWRSSTSSCPAARSTPRARARQRTGPGVGYTDEGPEHASHRSSGEDAVEALQEFVDYFTYLGVFAVLVLGSLGVPIPEELPIIAARRVEPRRHRPVVACAPPLSAGGVLRRCGALLGRPALG